MKDLYYAYILFQKAQAKKEDGKGDKYENCLQIMRERTKAAITQ